MKKNLRHPIGLPFRKYKFPVQSILLGAEDHRVGLDEGNENIQLEEKEYPDAINHGAADYDINYDEMTPLDCGVIAPAQNT